MTRNYSMETLGASSCGPICTAHSWTIQGWTINL